jgi:tetratricopeptide (TPR) repeat protein
MINSKRRAAVLFLTVIFVLPSCYRTSPANDARTAAEPEKNAATPAATSSPGTAASPSEAGDFSRSLSDYNAGNYEKAAAGFGEVVKSGPPNAEAHYYLGKSLGALKKDDGAAAALREAVKIKPDYAEANYELGNIYYRRREYETSLPFFERAAATNFKSTAMMMALGENYRALKRFDKSIVQYQKVIGFEPDNADAYYGLGLTYIGLDNKIGARQQLQKLTPLNKDLAGKLADRIGD